MDFKQWLNEISEPNRPLNKVSRKTIVKDAGTWRGRPVIEFKFKTTSGNEVKLHFEKIEDEGYDVMFYVNDTQHDSASGSQRDTEILSNVLWLIKNKADQLKAKVLTFIAQKGDGDTKIIKNMDVNRYKPAAMFELNRLKTEIIGYQVKMLQRNAAIYMKLNRPIPPAYPDLEKDKYLKILSSFEAGIESGNISDVLNNTLYLFEDLIKIGIDSRNFIKAMTELSNAQESNTEYGFRKKRNRREFVWEKLVKRYFPDWLIEKDGVKFKLTKNIKI